MLIKFWFISCRFIKTKPYRYCVKNPPFMIWVVSWPGPFCDGTFRDGSFRDLGPFVTGSFRDGTLCDGTFCDGSFRDGAFCMWIFYTSAPFSFLNHFRLQAKFLLGPNTVNESDYLVDFVNSVGNLWDLTKNHRGTSNIQKFDMKSKKALGKDTNQGCRFVETTMLSNDTKKYIITDSAVKYLVLNKVNSRACWYGSGLLRWHI
jgi:hypothetical protein